MSDEAERRAATVRVGVAALVAVGLFGDGDGGGIAGTYSAMKRGFRDMATRDPIDSLAVTVLTASYLFYKAEHATNPKVASIWDAIVFITTSLSVGYDDVFARTPGGKAIASWVQTVGPAMAAAALDNPRSADAEEHVQRSAIEHALIDRLDTIIEALRARPAPTSPG